MNTRTRLSLSYDELAGLLDAVEGVHRHLRTGEEAETLDRLQSRLIQHINRLNG